MKFISYKISVLGKQGQMNHGHNNLHVHTRQVAVHVIHMFAIQWNQTRLAHASEHMPIFLHAFAGMVAGFFEGTVFSKRDC